jgi:hypothetical protein
MADRRFPPPWTVEETDACFIVRDHNGQALSYVYFEIEPGRRTAANLLTTCCAKTDAWLSGEQLLQSCVSPIVEDPSSTPRLKYATREQASEVLP